MFSLVSSWKLGEPELVLGLNLRWAKLLPSIAHYLDTQNIIFSVAFLWCYPLSLAIRSCFLGVPLLSYLECIRNLAWRAAAEWPSSLVSATL